MMWFDLIAWKKDDRLVQFAICILKLFEPELFGREMIRYPGTRWLSAWFHAPPATIVGLLPSYDEQKKDDRDNSHMSKCVNYLCRPTLFHIACYWVET